ncbi:C4-dicarboxylate-specific signal transduction histidine kinase [Archangium gephyra]|uniref:histidine kinase n=1 Tax=Archangium gephyra TaxID=48 RepID=A0AAC8Q953_9BACT|nr:sensor histidine kinase [Archangium gephyra]AKJ02841.1 Sensor histidine kinase [Archangium gephyra]REG24970.1 C4-dicarboxylate-specific signal transduction histidine kinase [Archangium gephyra]
MRLYQQLVLFMLAATVLPLAAVGFLLLSRAEAELAGRIVSEQRVIAETTAESASSELMKTVDALARSAELFNWESITPEEFQGGLQLLYGQSPAVSAVLHLDAQGNPRGAPVFQAAGDSEHPGFEPSATQALARAVPVQTLRRGNKGQAALGRVYAHALSGRAAVAVAVKLGDGEDAPFALAEVVFSDLEVLLARRAEGNPGYIDLVDTTTGRILASSLPERRLRPLEPALASSLASSDAQVHGFRVDAPAMRVSAARVPKVPGFEVVVAVDEALALAPVHAMRRTVLLSIGGAFVVLLGLGALFTRRLNLRLSQVVAGAEAFGRGELERRVTVEGEDELSELASTFNRMGSELESARARMLRWNDDLKLRVDEATSELKAAQAQLLEAQKLAAVGQLGAGVAHEINNPLAGILGNTQLLMLERDEKDPDFDTLRKIELSAKRCKEITQNLLRFSQQRAKPELRAVDLNAILRDALSLTENQLKGEGIVLTTELASPHARVKADPGHLSQVVLALVSNARTAMMKTEAKRLTLRTGERDGRGFFEVEDTGKGIAPEHRSRIFEPFFTTKDVWSNVGLGLSVAWRVVSEAGGTIEVRTEVGQGTCFTVWLPKA